MEMKTFKLVNGVWLPKTLEEVFPFFADASNLERLTPPFLRFQILSPTPIEMKVGTLIDYKLRIRGILVRWQSEITVWDPPHRFVDEQRKGPYRLWIHEHAFIEKDCGTLAEDCVKYAVPGGAVINKLFVSRDVKKIFKYRNRKLLEFFDE